MKKPVSKANQKWENNDKEQFEEIMEKEVKKLEVMLMDNVNDDFSLIILFERKNIYKKQKKISKKTKII